MAKTNRELENENGLLIEALEEVYDRVKAVLSIKDSPSGQSTVRQSPSRARRTVRQH
jgi:hypothetical protein